MPQFAEKLWLPGSHYTREVTTLNRVLRAYDERLHFGRNEDNGDWCVFIKMEPGMVPEMVPVLGFQDKIPDPDELLRRVQAADTKRHGDYVLKQMNEHNEQLKRESAREAEDAEWQLAEAMESFLHAQGRTPYHRSLSKEVESKRTGGSDAST